MLNVFFVIIVKNKGLIIQMRCKDTIIFLHLQEKVIKNVNLRFIGHFRLFYNVRPKFKMEVQKM